MPSFSLDGPGQVRQHFGNKLVVGEPSGEKTPWRAHELAALLERAGLEAVLSDQIQKDIWFKLWGNMTMNPISAITGATTDRVLDDELVRGFISHRDARGSRKSERASASRSPRSPDDRHAVTRKLGAFKTSMLQDVEAGKAVELDALVTVGQGTGRADSMFPRPAPTRCWAWPGCMREYGACIKLRGSMTTRISDLHIAREDALPSPESLHQALPFSARTSPHIRAMESLPA